MISASGIFFMDRVASIDLARHLSALVNFHALNYTLLEDKVSIKHNRCHDKPSSDDRDLRFL